MPSKSWSRHLCTTVYGSIPTQLIDSLQLISRENQKFQIYNSKSNTVVGEKEIVIGESEIEDIEMTPISEGDSWG